MRIIFIKNFLIMILCIFFLNVYAVTQSNYQFIFPMQQQRFQHLISELRCLVCQNQSLAESNAPLAQDLKNIVYEQIQAGYTDIQIKQYLVQRYGEYVLFKPSINRTTIILWLGPVLFLCGAFIIMYVSIRRPAQGSDIRKHNLEQ